MSNVLPRAPRHANKEEHVEPVSGWLDKLLDLQGYRYMLLYSLCTETGTVGPELGLG